MRRGFALSLAALLTLACGVEPEDSASTSAEPPRPFVTERQTGSVAATSEPAATELPDARENAAPPTPE